MITIMTVQRREAEVDTPSQYLTESTVDTSRLEESVALPKDIMDHLVTARAPTSMATRSAKSRLGYSLLQFWKSNDGDKG